MQLSKPVKIGLVLIIAVGISIPLITWGIFTFNQPQAWDIRLFGSTVAEEKRVSYQEIINESLFTPLIDVPFNYTKANGANYLINFSGITIWDLILYSGVDYGAANAIRFHSWDGQASFVTVNLNTVEQNSSMILIAFAENGVLFGFPRSGEGPVKSIVDFRLTDPLISCAYATKWLNGIEFVIL